MHCHVVKTKDKERGKEKRMQSFDSKGGISKKNKECIVKLKEEVALIALIMCKIGILFDFKYIW